MTARGPGRVIERHARDVPVPLSRRRVAEDTRSPPASAGAAVSTALGDALARLELLPGEHAHDGGAAEGERRR